ncbi:hypothetical protein AMATHDRAFT_120343, partial [Amanita thiersii Skay4041]
FSFTLISVSQMDQNRFGIKMDGGICTITTPEPNSHIIGHIPEVQGLYCVSLATKHAHTEHAHLSSTKISISDLHCQMGHINHETLQQMVKDGVVTGMDLDLSSKPDFCPTCISAKAARLPFPKMSTSDCAKAYGDKIIADLWGPAQSASIKGKEYYLCFQDQFT